MPTSIQQSIESLMHETVEDGNGDTYNLKVCFRDHGVRDLYADPIDSHPPGADTRWDLKCVMDTVVAPGTTVLLDFGVCVSCQMDGEVPIPLLLIPRRSIAKTPLRMANSVGLIDGNDRGTITAMVDHRGTEPYTINKGDRLFQLMAMPTQAMTWSSVDTLGDTPPA